MNREIADVIAMIICLVFIFILMVIGWALNEPMYGLIATIFTPLFTLFEHDYVVIAYDWSRKYE